ncbi:MAG: hypothetical protein IJQ81_09200 [Oscillibacter sp.]|nr:hypothetical protein [Oscillibacter sp.]
MDETTRQRLRVIRDALIGKLNVAISQECWEGVEALSRTWERLGLGELDKDRGPGP